jgi:hypothetical protein
MSLLSAFFLFGRLSASSTVNPVVTDSKSSEGTEMAF